MNGIKVAELIEIIIKKRLTNNVVLINMLLDIHGRNFRKEEKMATRIAPTPMLNAKESRKFLKNVQRDLKSPVDYVPTPKLQKARELIEEYARKREK